MARWPMGAEADRAGSLVEQASDHLDGAAGGVQSCRKRTLTEHGVGIELAAAGGSRALDHRDVGLPVNERQHVPLHRGRRDPLEPEPVTGRQCLIDCDDPADPLGVPAGVVVTRRRV